MDRCMDLEGRGLMTEAGRLAFEKASYTFTDTTLDELKKQTR
jgi:hypothetical protein